jgi:hypothetical protein
MTWKGITRANLDRLIADDLAQMDDVVQAAWQGMRSSTPSEPRALTTRLATFVAEKTGGWRSLDDYLNHAGDMFRGYGILMTAPSSIAVAACGVLETEGVSAYMLDAAMPATDGRAVIMGQNAIVARTFRFERTTA